MFVLSAAAAAALLRLAWEQPSAALVGLLVAAGVLGARGYSRWRLRRLLRAGDVDSVLARWRDSLERVPHAATMGPLMTATAFAAFGWIERAREVLRTAERGPAWDAALEHRLFLDTLLHTFEGDPDEAIAAAQRLAELPLPTSLPFLVNRIRTLRGAAAALARAFSHQTRTGDRGLLIAASDASPLVHWAMRYAAAISAVDDGELDTARTLLVGAPSWPVESCFRGFHDEICEELDRRARGGAAPPGAPA
jgi:hypothetical protein